MSQVERQRRRLPDSGAAANASDSIEGGGGEQRRKLSANAQAPAPDCKLPAAASAALIDATAQAGELQVSAQLQQVARKLTSGAEEFDKTNYQSLEVNNNSIAPSSKQQAVILSVERHANELSATKLRASRACQTPPPPPTQAQQQQERLETPLSLLTGLRMHASNLRAQREQSATTPNPQASSSERKLPQSKESEQAAARISPSTAAAASTASYVESSLNPPEAERGNKSPQPRLNKATQFEGPPSQAPNVSIFSQRPLTATATVHSSPSPDTQRGLGRSLLIKRQPETLSRNFFSAPINSGGNLSNQRGHLPASLFDDRQPRTTATRVLPSISPASRRRRLQLLEGNNIIDFNSGQEDDEEEDEEDDEEEEEEDEEEDEIDYQDRTDSSNFSTSGQRKSGGHLLSNLSQENKRLVNSSPESLNQKQKQKQLVKAPSIRSSGRLTGSARRGRSPARRGGGDFVRIPMGQQHHSQQQQHNQQQAQGKKAGQHHPTGRSQSQTRASLNDTSRPPSFNTVNSQQQQHHLELDMKNSASCRKLDLLEQVAHLECGCAICAKNRKLGGGSLHDNLYNHHNHQHQIGSSTSKLAAGFNMNRSGLESERHYPKTRFMHMVLKSIILILCTLLLLLLLVGGLLISHYLPQSLDKVVSATRSFNVTVAGRR